MPMRTTSPSRLTHSWSLEYRSSSGTFMGRNRIETPPSAPLSCGHLGRPPRRDAAPDLRHVADRGPVGQGEAGDAEDPGRRVERLVAREVAATEHEPGDREHEQERR